MSRVWFRGSVARACKGTSRACQRRHGSHMRSGFRLARRRGRFPSDMPSVGAERRRHLQVPPSPDVRSTPRCPFPRGDTGASWRDATPRRQASSPPRSAGEDGATHLVQRVRNGSVQPFPNYRAQLSGPTIGPNCRAQLSGPTVGIGCLAAAKRTVVEEPPRERAAVIAWDEWARPRCGSTALLLRWVKSESPGWACGHTSRSALSGLAG